MLCLIFADAALSHILDNFLGLKPALASIIEPDFGLLDELLAVNVLDRRQLADVRSERTVYRRNDAMLDLLVSEDQCDKFLKALERTGQQHIANFITQNGGQLHYCVVTCQLTVSFGGGERIIM